MRNDNTAGRVKRAKTFRQIRAARQRAEMWRQRWQSHPESMRANLERINSARRQIADRRTERLKSFVASLPKTMGAGELRGEMSKALATFNLPSTRSEVERILSALRRRSLISFDHASLTWSTKVG